MLEHRFYKMMYWAMIFLALGIFVSVSIPSLYHMLFFVPIVYFAKKDIKSLRDISKSSWALIILTLVAYISNTINFSELVNPVRSFGRQKYILFGVFALYPLRHIFKNYMDPQKVRVVLNTFWVTIIMAAIYGTLKERYDFNLLKMSYEYTKGYRNGGFTGIMRYGYGMSFVLTLMFGLHLYRDRFLKILNLKLFYTAMLIGGIGFVLSFTRGALLGLICSAPFILLFYRKKLGIIAFLLAGITISGLATISFMGGSSSSRFFTKISQSSNLKRLSQYEASSRAFLERPILGHGMEQFSGKCREIKNRYNIYYPNYCQKFGLNCDYSGAPQYCSHAHNILLSYAADLGVLGFLCLSAWIFLWAFELFKRNDVVTFLFIPLLVNILVAGQFELIFDANNSFMLFFLYPLSFLKKEDLNDPFLL